MTEIEVLRYQKGDVYKLAGCEGGLEDAFMNGECFTGIAEDGAYVFCCGIVLYWPGHGEVWTLLSEPSNRYIQAYEKIRDLLEWMIQKHNLFRVSAHCRENWEGANRLIQHLGFSHEATLKSYGPNKEAFNLYGRIIDG